MAKRLALVLFGLVCCDGVREGAPRGEALFVVDTDVAVPELVSKLRVDIYREDGTWIDSSTFMRTANDWPSSFSVYVNGTGASVALVRLRAYPDGVERDYHGERYLEPPAPTPADDDVPEGDPTPGETPRLLIDKQDATPRSEPTPFAAIDRLVRVRLEYGTRGSARVTLHGECFGRMADLANRSTCIDEKTSWTTAIDQALDPNMTIGNRGPTPFGARVPCAAPLRTARPNLFEEEVCVPGGAFLFGDPDGFGDGISNASVPERIARMSPFRMDRYEVTVGRWRAAIADGFPGGTPGVNDGPLVPGTISECTYTSTPMMREDFPVNCVTPEDAGAFCKWLGASLPTEAQWKWAAQAADHAHKTRYPWGDDAPDCAKAVYGRDPNIGLAHVCAKTGLATSPQSESTAKGDLSEGTAIFNMAGNVAEMLADTFHSFGSRCWAFPKLDDPQCVDDVTVKYTVAGGMWNDDVVSTLSRTRRGIDAGAVTNETGFRCVRGM